MANPLSHHKAIMLRITSISDAEGQRLKLEGKLLGPWVEELRIHCASISAQLAKPQLDLEAVSYVDSAGAKVLQTLRAEGFPIVASSPFVAMILREEQQ
jgi:uncharacterized protein YqfA (UPF0365 family)